MTQTAPPLPVEIGLTAAIVAVSGAASSDTPEPMILVARAASAISAAALPSGPVDPVAHRTFEIGLRAHCDALLKSAEARIEKITLSSSGAPKGVEPLDVDEPKP